MRIRGAWFACWVLACAASLPCAAQLTESEKQLLLGAMTEQSAVELGRAADAGALKRIINMGDPQLVRAFSRGMEFARVERMSPEIEALVVAHFHDARVGEALRALSPWYRTRPLFDLYYARVQSAFRADEPSFKQILRTDQPGIDDALLRVVDKFPARDELNPVVIFVGERKHPAAVPLLISSLEQGYRILGRVDPRHNRPMGLLLAYPSPDTWRKASEEIERLNREGRITPQAYKEGRDQLDRALADADLTLARMRRSELRTVFERRRAALVPNTAQIATLKEASPREYLEQQRKHLAALDGIAAELGDESVGYGVGNDYFMLGLHARFRLRDAAAARDLFAKGAAYRHAMSQIALADLFELELKDKAAALKAYEAALEEASRPTERRPFFPYGGSGTAGNDFYRAWLAQEIEYLRTGRPFQGRIPEKVIAGFFDVLIGNVGYFIDTLAADVPMDVLPSAGFASVAVPAYARMAPAATSWDDVQASFERIERAGLAQKLEKLPPSRLALFLALRPISALPAPDILRLLARSDPSGYWSACVLGTVSYLSSKGAAGRQESVRNGTAHLLPGMAAPGNPNALSSAASQFLASRGLRVKAEAR